MRFDTRLVHVGHEPQAPTGDVVPPIHLATTYERRVQDPPRYFYARGENPTREALERCLAAVEDAAFACAFTSGQAAGATVLSMLRPGARLIASDDVYGGTHALFDLAGRQGIAVSRLDLTDPGALDTALDQAPPPSWIWIETPTNPLLRVADLTAICTRARARGIRVLVDNTFAGPVLQRPLGHGADVVLHSTTKSIAGHSDVLGGALICDDPELHRSFTAHRATVGSAPGGLDCYLVRRGLQTLSLRVARQVSNAQTLVEALQSLDQVRAVHYPGLAEHPQHEVAARQMTAPGSIFSFEYSGDPEKLMGRLSIFSCAVSLGGVRSLIECPAMATHALVPRETRLKLGITDSLLRVSAGIEDPADLVADLTQAVCHGTAGEERD